MIEWMPSLLRSKTYPEGVNTLYERLAWDRLQSYKQWRDAQTKALMTEFRINGIPPVTITMADVKLLCK